MTKKDLRKYLDLRLRLAEDKIESARILLDNEKFRDSVSRSYYAMFYAARALLLSKGEDATSHKGVKILFGKHFVKGKIIDKSYGRMLAVVQKARTDADYEEDLEVTREDAGEALSAAARFVNKIKELLK